MAPKSAECELRTLVMSCCANRMQELNGMLDGESSYVKVEQKSVDLKAVGRVCSNSGILEHLFVCMYVTYPPVKHLWSDREIVMNIILQIPLRRYFATNRL